MGFLDELWLNALAYAVLAAAAGLALLVLRRGAGPWLPLPRLRRGKWAGGEVFFCFVIFLFVPVIITRGLNELNFFRRIFDADVSSLRQFNLLSIPNSLLAFLLQLLVLFYVSRTYAAQVGLTSARWRANTATGLAVFIVATPIVLLAYYLALLAVERREHPLEELARESLYAFEWVFLVAQATVMAPVMEEWLFRGLLQGWLRRASPLGHFIVAALTVLSGSEPTLTALMEDKATVNWGPLVFTSAVVVAYLAAVIRIWRPVFLHGLNTFVDAPEGRMEGRTLPGDSLDPFRETAAEDADTSAGELPLPVLHGPRWERFKRHNAQLAVVGSAMLFAVFHVQAWPAPIPLFLFALIVGWLAYRTQSLVPGIVLHTLFNLVASLVLLYSRFAE